ncbi:MAG: hypothetical protein HRT77_07745 [Halioglobus sp.]|nr:hypothetical protein [Halioglobus sp.]
MSTIDIKVQALRALGYEGSLSTMTLAWLQSDPAVSAVTLRSAWSQWLSARGHSEGVFDERWYFFLGGAGYAGTLKERERQFWAALVKQVDAA